VTLFYIYLAGLIFWGIIASYALSYMPRPIGKARIAAILLAILLWPVVIPLAAVKGK